MALSQGPSAAPSSAAAPLAFIAAYRKASIALKRLGTTSVNR
jgi:hypothetical protein